MKTVLKGGVMALCSLLAACSQGKDHTKPVEVAKGRVAVVYFSWSESGNTKFAAETIAAKCSAVLFRIEALKPYPAEYGACCDEAKPECRSKSLRPIKPISGLDLSKYDVVFVGTPNWWGTMAPPVRMFLSANLQALNGKILCIFQTNGGGGMQRVGSDFAELVGGAAKVLEPKAFAGSSIRRNASRLEDFVKERIILK